MDQPKNDHGAMQMKWTPTVCSFDVCLEIILFMGDPVYRSPETSGKKPLPLKHFQPQGPADAETNPKSILVLSGHDAEVFIQFPDWFRILRCSRCLHALLTLSSRRY
jgi:hypothetical protein